MKILVSGFDPFGGEKINPAFEAIKLLPDTIAKAKIIKIEVPTVFTKCAEVLREGILEHKPDAVLSVGQAGNRAAIAVERVAINLVEARIPDNEGAQPLGQKLIKDGKNAYFTSLPAKAMVKNVEKHGIPAYISYTAGTYVCNDIMYRLLHMIETEFQDIRGGFIHVPYSLAQTVDKPVGTPSMSIESISDGLHYAIEAIVLHKKDIHSVEGEIA